ncbi:DNA polymerase III subunit epsilon [Gilvimarinus agarilyticus]|uniref:DNA polymerase III subunit epsilon n=1 Tax=unclassified Gilvimarinus TaxID=2642066 RepID=UPI001C09949F|nr:MULTISPECIES: DNA polymerase III subunit epsilon [unclassified Gilvimarinus]MBU2887078.1 DNA polymerase III subunit epsilon [Gilvimarinus agarilyticus]MDO6571737.1 DNA polymerase III subunit epsilon [Gilvimarinus sp. 2_MG-2023]MDO6745809.1 DNA polymerase III subunit epsilon [Gilvimarinus sp. 1_MG-2023]
MQDNSVGHRQIVLDTETTGLDPKQGHKIIEIGCVEMINRKLTGKHYHQYINPQREVDAGAIEVHGITNEMLEDKPIYAQISGEFMAFIAGAELVIHNAPFDVGFIDHELRLLDPSHQTIALNNNIVDSLLLARGKHPGQRNSLDALCKRYGVDNSQRELHGALLDAEILADVYLLMTGGQTALSLGSSGNSGESESNQAGEIHRLDASRPALPVIAATEQELARHQDKLAQIDKACGGSSLWSQ